MTWRIRGACGAFALLLAVGCERPESVRERRRAETPHEVYALALESAGLDGTALFRDWAAAAERALLEPANVRLPFRETGYLAPEQPTALGYRFELRRGRRLAIDIDLAAADSMRVFLDLFHLAGDSILVPRWVASANGGATRLEHEPRRDGEYMLRIQPELLRGARFTLTISNAATLAFPVEGVGPRSIHSIFGDPREGGRRDHHGIDIFARRGTPAIAATAGTVTAVRTTRIGGKVVWLRDEDRSQTLYYAHLDRQLVRPGRRVRAGDTLGLVGNSGNARTTPPHLHFGIYRRGEGPIDPLPFVTPQGGQPARITADTALLGRWTRAARDRLRVRAGPDLRTARVDELPLHTAMRVLGASGRWYRVRLPDGRPGYVASWLTEAAALPIAERKADAPAPMLAGPAAHEPVVERLDPGESFPVLGRFGEFLMIRAPGGSIGWLPLD